MQPSPCQLAEQWKQKAQVHLSYQPGQGPGCKACQAGEQPPPAPCLPVPQAALCPSASPSSAILEGGSELVGRPKRQIAPSWAPFSRAAGLGQGESSQGNCRQERGFHCPLNSLTNNDHLLWQQKGFCLWILTFNPRCFKTVFRRLAGHAI